LNRIFLILKQKHFRTSWKVLFTIPTEECFPFRGHQQSHPLEVLPLLNCVLYITEKRPNVEKHTLKTCQSSSCWSLLTPMQKKAAATVSGTGRSTSGISK